jgi:hypothetical protein
MGDSPEKAPRSSAAGAGRRAASAASAAALLGRLLVTLQAIGFGGVSWPPRRIDAPNSLPEDRFEGGETDKSHTRNSGIARSVSPVSPVSPDDTAVAREALAPAVPCHRSWALGVGTQRTKR